MMRASLGPTLRSNGLDARPFLTLVGTAQIAQASRSHRVRSGEKVVEQHTEAVDVAPDRRFLASQQLGCEVERRAGETSGGVVAQLASRAEVHQHDAAIVRQHHVMALDVAMQQTGAVHGANRAAEINADLNGLRYSEAPALLEQLFERASLDELHPQADLVANLLGAVDGDDVRMANLRQQSAFFDDRAGACLAGQRVGRQELERDFAVEPSVAGAVDLSESAAANRRNQLQVSPSFKVCSALGCRIRRIVRPIVLGQRDSGQIAVNVGKGGQDSQAIQQRTAMPADVRRGRGPVDWRAVENGVCHIVEEAIICRHGSSPRRAASGHDERSCVRHRRTACPAPLPAPRRCSQSRHVR